MKKEGDQNPRVEREEAPGYSAPQNPIEIDRLLDLTFLHQMLLIRRFEEKAGEMKTEE